MYSPLKVLTDDDGVDGSVLGRLEGKAGGMSTNSEDVRFGRLSCDDAPSVDVVDVLEDRKATSARVEDEEDDALKELAVTEAKLGGMS